MKNKVQVQIFKSVKIIIGGAVIVYLKYCLTNKCTVKRYKGSSQTHCASQQERTAKNPNEISKSSEKRPHGKSSIVV